MIFDCDLIATSSPQPIMNEVNGDSSAERFGVSVYHGVDIYFQN